MKFRGKEVEVVLSKDARQQYDELKSIAAKEQKNGVNNSFNQQLLKSIDSKIAYLKMNPIAGDHAQKPLPNYLVQKYGINNIWIIDLTGYWRMIYTLNSGEIKIISLVLEWMNHQKYDKVFGRKNK